MPPQHRSQAQVLSNRLSYAHGNPDPPKVYDNVNPFTGLSLHDPIELLNRPVMVKLANWPRSLRPFNQINQADIVFEYYNGHQTNHLLALFYTSNASAVGPLAPGRLLDARLARHYQADLVVASAPEVVEGVFANTLPDRVFYRGYAPAGICTETEAQGGNTVVDTSAIRDFLLKTARPAPPNGSKACTFRPRSRPGTRTRAGSAISTLIFRHGLALQPRNRQISPLAGS